MAKAEFNGVTIADSPDTVVVEGNHYFPSGALVPEHFEESDHTSVCPWKGTANYYHVVVNGERNENAAWIYRTTKDAAANITGRVAFWKGVTVSG